MTKFLLFLCVPICLAVPFFYFNRWLIRKLRPNDSLRKMLIYYSIVLPVSFVLVTLCIYLILRGYLWMRTD